MPTAVERRKAAARKKKLVMEFGWNLVGILQHEFHYRRLAAAEQTREEWWKRNPLLQREPSAGWSR